MDGSGATELLKPKDTLATDTKGNLIEMMQKPYGLAIDYKGRPTIHVSTFFFLQKIFQQIDILNGLQRRFHGGHLFT